MGYAFGFACIVCGVLYLLGVIDPVADPSRPVGKSEGSGFYPKNHQ